jgi:hypothetical protein
MFKKLKGEAAGLAWTLGGIAMVLITLSGETLKWGLWISGVSLFIYLAGLAFSNDDD